MKAQILKKSSMWPMPLTPIKAAVHTLNLPNVSSCIRDLALAAWCFMQAAFLIACFLRRFFRASALRLSLNSRFLPWFPPWFFRHDGCSTPTTPRLLHSRLSSLRVPRFPRRCSNFAAPGTVATLLGCITTNRCCWHACTVSIDEFPHQSMSSWCYSTPGSSYTGRTGCVITKAYGARKHYAARPY